MRRIIIGLLFAAVCALGLAPPASAEPNGNRTIVEPLEMVSPASSTILACESENCRFIDDQATFGPKGGRLDQAAFGPTYKIDSVKTHIAIPASNEGWVTAKSDPTDRPIGIAIAAIEIDKIKGLPWAFAHKTANGPCKDVVPRRDGQCIIIDTHHVPGAPCTA